ncbi:hypothetical protein M8C21_005382 [Ambrosia artemisiifolia]|uniref:Transmembrane protein n=1 Tax=Ambrosia artemisiifolia TaxID=4212 RepID=A0AAD5BLQ6_AMBAR|nr:hypothetical protein M8C21_005382 [Ambrosia artemisiifolia]
MDYSDSKAQGDGFDVDLESGVGIVQSNAERISDSDSDKKLAKTAFLRLCDGLMSVDDDSLVKSDTGNVNEGCLESIVKCKKGSSAKKPPRPPRPLSLDAYDQKLIKELAELAMIKRARVERMKALKQKKNSKISSSSSSSHGSVFAMIFTIIFFLVILFQGHNSGVTIQATPQTGQVKAAPQTGQRNTNGLTVLQNQLNISPSVSVSSNYKSSTGF